MKVFSLQKVTIGICITVGFFISGCAHNAKPFVEAKDATHSQSVFVAAMRTIERDEDAPLYSVDSSTLGNSGKQEDLYELDRFGNVRAEKPVFLKDTVSLPFEKPGKAAKLVPKGQAANPNRHFAYTQRQQIKDAREFAKQVWASTPGHDNRVVLFVHGNNVDILQATARYAKVQLDFKLAEKKLPSVVFVGQSSGAIRGYAYDRESMRFDRSNLEDLINALTSKGQRVIIVAHSLGTDFTMETLARMKLKNPASVKSKIGGVILIAPDLSMEVFKSQVRDIEPLPKNFVILTHTKDLALRVSALIRRNKQRLGVVGAEGKDAEIAADICKLGVTFWNLDQFTDGDFLRHTTPFSSGKAIKTLITHINSPNFVKDWLTQAVGERAIDVSDEPIQEADVDSLEEAVLEIARAEGAETTPIEPLTSEVGAMQTLEKAGFCVGRL